MKLFADHLRRARLPARRSGGFTLVELYIATFLMVTFILGGLIAVNMMGMREYQLLQSKAGASDSARKSITQLKNAIYGAKGWQVGSYSGSTFVAVTNGAALQGNALMIYPLIITSNQIVDVTKYYLYYFDTNQAANMNGLLMYMDNTGTNAGTALISVSNLIAPLYFTVENYRGTTLSNQTYKSVIHATFQYSQFQYPLTPVGSNGLFNSYRMDVRATPYLPDGP